MRRKLDLAIISDLHLGTYGAKADEVLSYLQSIQPKTLVLNGDIIDMWRMSKSYWTASHTEVINEIVRMSGEGTEVHYLTGNHDDSLRKLTGFKLGNFELKNKLVLNLDGKKAWIFHGDVFDVSIKYARRLAQLGAFGYDMLLMLNSATNKCLDLMGMEKKSFSQSIKNRVKTAIKKLDDFEKTAATLALEKGYDYFICGHTHQPCIKEVRTEKGAVTYLNSGDWVENMTALEYSCNQWKLYRHKEEGRGLTHRKAKPASLTLTVSDVC